ncbi:transglutaminase family protein, partial [Bacteroidota bacterium]
IKNPTKDKHYYMAFELNNVLCGYSDINISETEKYGEKIILLHQKTVIIVSALNKTITQKMEFNYHIDPSTGNFIYHDSNIEAGEFKISGSVTITDNKAIIQSPNSMEDVITPIPENTILPNTFYYTYLLEDFVEKNLKEKIYQMYDVTSGKIKTTSYTKIGEEKLELAGETYNSIVLNELNNATSLKSKIWIDSSTGIKLKTNSPNNLVTYLTDSEVVNKIGVGDMNENFFIKTNKSIKDITKISYIKVRGSLEPAPFDGEKNLNVPGQSFKGSITGDRIEGIFTVEHSKYNGSNAPSFPSDYSQNKSLKNYLNAEETIESDNPKIIQKAKEITSGAKDSWEAAVLLNKWIGNNIKGDIEGGNTALEAFEKREGICGPKSMLLAAFCRSIGIPARVVWGCLYTKEYGGSFGHHAWNEIYMGKAGWIPVDATIREYDYVDSGHIRLGILHSKQTIIGFKEMEILDYRVK